MFRGHSRSCTLGSLNIRRGTVYYSMKMWALVLQSEISKEVRASLFSRTPLSFGAPYLGNPVNIRINLLYNRKLKSLIVNPAYLSSEFRRSLSYLCRYKSFRFWQPISSANSGRVASLMQWPLGTLSSISLWSKRQVCHLYFEQRSFAFYGPSVCMEQSVVCYARQQPTFETYSFKHVSAVSFCVILAIRSHIYLL